MLPAGTHWFPLFICLSHPSFPSGLPNHIPWPCRYVVRKFLLFGQHWHLYAKGSIGKSCLCVRPFFFMSVPHLLLI